MTSLGEEKPPVVNLPEYTDPIGTAGQEAPILSLPEYVLRVLKDQDSKGEVISGENEIGRDSQLEIQKVLDQSLFGKNYDAFKLQLRDKEGNPVPVKGSLLVRLPLSGEVKQLYILTPNQGLQALNFTLREGMIEFMVQELGTYAIVYKSDSSEKMDPTVSESKGSYSPVSEHPSPTNTSDALMSVPNSRQDQASQGQLPKTNTEHSSSYLVFLAGLSLVLAASFLEKKKQD